MGEGREGPPRAKRHRAWGLAGKPIQAPKGATEVATTAHSATLGDAVLFINKGTVAGQASKSGYINQACGSDKCRSPVAPPQIQG